MDKSKKGRGGARVGAGRHANSEKKLVTGFRASAETNILIKKFASMYGGTDQAILTVMKGYEAMMGYTTLELQGLFSKEELLAIAAAQNGVRLVGELQADVHAFQSTLEDYQDDCNGIREAGADPESLLGKVKKLTASQVYFLQDAIDRAWKTGEGAIDQFAEIFAR